MVTLPRPLDERAWGGIPNGYAGEIPNGYAVAAASSAIAATNNEIVIPSAARDLRFAPSGRTADPSASLGMTNF